MTKNIICLLSLICSLLHFDSIEISACTSAIISARITADGRPLLWKNRDTSATDNKVETITFDDGRYSYTALFNAFDYDCKEAWMGMNVEGFAIMNTASYNLKNDQVPQSEMDREGYVMTIALSTCVTIDDFAQLLDSLPKPLGVEANFGVIDATGNGAYFETDNYSYKRYDLKDSPSGYMVRTNYSHGGRAGEGYGFTRENDAIQLLNSAAQSASVTPELLTETLSRSFYNATLSRDYSGEKGLVIDEGFIPRYKTTATIVIEGCRPSDDINHRNHDLIARQYIMWTALGYPPCARIVPVWLKSGGVDEGLRGTEEAGRSRYCNEAKALRDSVFVKKGGEKPIYIDMTQLFKKDGSGICQRLREENLKVYKLFKVKRDRGE